MKKKDLVEGERYVIKWRGYQPVARLLRIVPPRDHPNKYRVGTRYQVQLQDPEAKTKRLELKSATRFLYPCMPTEVSVPVVHKTTGDKASLVVPGTAINQVPEEMSDTDKMVDELLQAVKRWQDNPMVVKDPTDSLYLRGEIVKVVQSHLQGMEMDNMASS